jgi:transposase
MAGALAYRPDASEAALMFQIKEGSYNTESLIEFLTDLHTHFGDDKITLIWDNLPSHKSKAMTAWIAGQRQWLTVERLPGYAHDLNPIEMVWGNIKTVDLANLCPDTIDEAHAAAEAGLNRVGSNYELCFAFLAHTGLSL